MIDINLTGVWHTAKTRTRRSGSCSTRTTRTRPGTPSPRLHRRWTRCRSPGSRARDIPNVLLFLASDETRYITGVPLPVDAGCLIT